MPHSFIIVPIRALFFPTPLPLPPPFSVQIFSLEIPNLVKWVHPSTCLPSIPECFLWLHLSSILIRFILISFSWWVRFMLVQVSSHWAILFLGWKLNCRCPWCHSPSEVVMLGVNQGEVIHIKAPRTSTSRVLSSRILLVHTLMFLET